VRGPAGLFGVARLSDELVRWYAGAPFPPERPTSAAEFKQSALDSLARWPAEVVEVLHKTDEDDYPFNDTPHARPLRAWGEGRITLLGDAAHSSVPTLGISAGLAIEDAAVWRSAFARPEPSSPACAHTRRGADQSVQASCARRGSSDGC
jgi:FAD-dependent urate hydroxylase